MSLYLLYTAAWEREYYVNELQIHMFYMHEYFDHLA